MSYKQPTISTEPGVFYGYRATDIAINTPNTIIPLTDTSPGQTISAGSVSFGSTRNYYVTGEVRVTISGTYQLGEIRIVTNSGESAEGYQVRNNANGTVLMDDACYGVGSQNSVSLYVGDTGYTIESDANETRLIGVFTS